jgi:hypothetical protein
MSDMMPDDEALLRRARIGLEPTGADQARVRQKVFAQIGLGVGGATSALSASTAAKTGASIVAGSTMATAAKVFGGLLIVGGLVGASAVVVREFHASGTATSSPPGIATRGSLKPVPAPLGSGLLGAPPPVAATVSAPPSGPPVPPVSVNAVPRVVDRAAATTTTATRANPSDNVLYPPASVVSAATTAGPTEMPPTASAATTEPRTATISGPATVAAEAKLLREADGALRAGDPTRALVLLNEHAASFPQGVLVEERNAERIVALCALGQKTQAREAASTFLRDHGGSPLAARVRASCAAP